ncbi:MAG: iron-containing redox enzyme family protein [Candidatus Binatia bacterium]|nr:iron-containing redox enzyme family protein [Candidatus Binatia bacterium]
MQTADAFVQDLRAYIAKEDEKPLLGPSFYRAVLDGTLTREQLKRWAVNLFYVTGQHIRAFGGIFLNTGLGPLDQKIRRHIVENLIDEETTMGRGDDAHWMLSMRLAKALGATDEELMHPVVAKEAVDYVEWVLELGRREYGLVTLAAMSLGGETRSDHSMRGFVRALREKYGLSREDLEFFYAHMGEAEAHGEPVFAMVREYATTEERQQKIRDSIRTWCEKFSAAQEGGYRVALGIEQGVQVHLA